ncbi:MAG: hypothetical protein RMK84_05665 [Oscillochloridaceae bacterium]|nr:hypothetical protein [Chloroflexaceae bacterium]MDW8389591.1 hypothetical protein [Oscillochloridaceae bacterium]
MPISPGQAPDPLPDRRRINPAISPPAPGLRAILLYLACGVRDVLVVDPRTGLVYHDAPDRPRRTLAAPITIDLACGCRLTI